MPFLQLIRFIFDETDKPSHFCGMDKMQRDARDYRALPRANYHLCTDGWQEGKLFNNRAQFRYGMATMALVAIKFDVRIISFELMPNHIHIILNADGDTCLAVFQYIRRRTAAMLKDNGFPPLPEDYWFKLKILEDDQALRQEIIYLARNAYEKGFAIPGGYPWGSSYLYFSRIADYIRGPQIKNWKTTDIRQLTGSKNTFPDTWEMHPELGILPRSYVCSDLVQKLFSSAKEYMTRLVKDYESAIHIAAELGEEVILSRDEQADIVYRKACAMFPGRSMKELASHEKGRLAVVLEKEYHFSVQTLASLLYMPERVIRQFLGSKDYGYREWK